MTERKATRRPARKAKPKAGTELAVIPKTQLELDFERILAEMHTGFDRAENEVLANLDEINAMIDFTELRKDIDTRFDIIEQAGEEEAARLRRKQDDPVLDASVDFAKAQDELADSAERLHREAFAMAARAADAHGRLATVAAFVDKLQVPK